MTSPRDEFAAKTIEMIETVKRDWDKICNALITLCQDDAPTSPGCVDPVFAAHRSVVQMKLLTDNLGETADKIILRDMEHRLK